MKSFYILLYIFLPIIVVAQNNGYDAIQAYQFGQSLWYYNPSLDITDALAQIMNDDYNSSTVVETEEN